MVRHSNINANAKKKKNHLKLCFQNTRKQFGFVYVHWTIWFTIREDVFNYIKRDA